jgi:hypothetical protein
VTRAAVAPFALAIAACAEVLSTGTPPLPAAMPAPLADATAGDPAPGDAGLDAPVDGELDAAVADGSVAEAIGSGEVWLRGSTHVHAAPSGDSTTPIPDVIRWYEQHNYDFIFLTDHNKVSELGSGYDTHGQVAIRAPARGLIVLAGVELTHNPVGCEPPGDKSKRCRIHINALGVTERPTGKIDWAPRRTHDRVTKYQAAFDTARRLGAALIQINHPQWFWGMTPAVLVELCHRGATLFEIANIQFAKWNAGNADHPSTEALWDDALASGALLWGVASDDAHSYGKAKGPWPAGGAWIEVKARRDPQAIVDAIGRGRFYSSTGVELARADVDGGDLVVEVAPGQAATTTVWIENGHEVDRVAGATARRALPQAGYLRAVVQRDDGARAWVQPARR